jgi:hypothetical protein|tara:strand:+ start:848 stop:1951 length:1104 start_codon:yes stop_codon:yes gene_type:complete
MHTDEGQPELDLTSAEEIKQEELEQKKKMLLESVRAFTLDSAEQKVAWILNNYPETRNSDITLQIKFWEHFNKDLVSSGQVQLSDMYSLPRLNSLTRHRARIQNDYGLFLAEKVVRKRRGKLSEKEKEDAIEKSEEPTDCSLIFADESGKNEAYSLVGSVWFALPLSAFLVDSAINEFREHRLGGKELHFTKAGKKDRATYEEFLSLIISNMNYLGFKAVYLSNAGIRNKQEAFSKLFYHLVARGVEHEVSSSRVRLPREIEFTKDSEEEGYDQLLLAEMKDRLKHHSAANYKGQAKYTELVALDSKKSNLLQLADVYTGCLHRVLNHKAEKNWKDSFAENFLESVGTQISQFGTETSGDSSIAIKL